MVDTYTESELKTILACPKLYSLGGSVDNYSVSHSFLHLALKYFNLDLVKDTDRDLDICIDRAVKKAFSRHYIAAAIDPDEIIRLKEYAYSFLNNYLLLFNIKEYQIVLGPNEFTLNYDEANIRIFVDAVYKQADRKGFLHVVCFYPDLNEHILANDFFINLKAYFYKKYASTARKHSNSEVTIHIISSKSFDRYKSKTKDYIFHHKAIPITELTNYDPTYHLQIANMRKTNTNSIPVCPNKKCSKRRECIEQLR